MKRDPETWEDALDEVLAEMRAIMVERQRKYGPNNIMRAGIMGVLRRASDDKLGRLLRYYEREDLRSRCIEAGMPRHVVDEYLPALQDDFSDESLEDAHIDAANYLGPISIMLRRGWWTLPFEP